MANLLIVRGLPGSGKSTFARSMKPLGYVHLEADMFFMIDGVYKFDPSRLAAAHEWCKSEMLFHLGRGHNVVVSNTFTRVWMISDYLAKVTRETVVTVITVEGDWGNVHGVPESTLQKMRNEWEPWRM